MSLLLFQISQCLVILIELPHQVSRLCHSVQLHKLIQIEILCIICNTRNLYIIPTAKLSILGCDLQHMIRAVYLRYIQFFQKCAKLVHIAGSIGHHCNNFRPWKFTSIAQIFKKVVLQSIQIRVTCMQPTTKNLVLQLKILVDSMGHHSCVVILTTLCPMISGK